MTGNAFGKPRYGRPKTDAERLKTHYALTGETNLPARGTRIQKTYNNQTFKPSIPSVFMDTIIGYTLYPAFKDKSKSTNTQLILGLALGYAGYAIMHGISLSDMFKLQLNSIGG